MLNLTLATIEQGIAVDRGALERLLLAAGNGSRDAFAALYERSRTAVYAMALSVVKNADLAQDITQDAFVAVWEHAPLYRSQGSPMAWILTITRNLALMELRRRGKAADLSESEWSAIPADAPRVSTEERMFLEKALGSLGDEERRIVLLHAVSGLKHREIAALLELPLATVLSKYHRAIKKLRSLTEGEDVL